MMGRVAEQGQLFYRFKLDNHVPDDHFLRQVDRFLDFKPLRDELAPLYSHTGRPSDRSRTDDPHAADRLPLRHPIRDPAVRRSSSQPCVPMVLPPWA